MLEEVLHVLGVPGTIVSVVGIILTAYHGKHLLDVFTKIGIWARIGGAVLVAGIVISLLVPGINVSVDFGALLGAAEGFWNLIPLNPLS